jgi:hypothetical protein
MKLGHLQDKHFYFPLNSGQFYYRHDAGQPGATLIGAHQEAIKISNVHHVIIDGIDAYGPGGRRTSGGSSGFSAIAVSDNSHDIALKNLTISYGNSVGISADYTTRNIVYENLDVHHNGGTGIYMNSTNGSIIGCMSYYNGHNSTDVGDRGGIGSYRGSNLQIIGNEVHHNGPEKGNADFEISIVSTGKVDIAKNFIHDCIQGCVQIAEGGDKSTIRYNIISGYGSARGKMPSIGKLSGVRIGGGSGGSKDISIYNNVIRGGRIHPSSGEAGIYVTKFDNSGLKVQNNIFTGNTNKHVNIHNDAPVKSMVFSNNLFSKNLVLFRIGNRDMRHLLGWRELAGFGENSLISDALLLNTSGMFSNTNDFKLQPTSPAIDHGVATPHSSDFFGAPVPSGKYTDIGVHEFQ